jgi:hypothetical protein
MVLVSGIFHCEKSYALDPKVKVLATMAAYGTAGGALLGAASMAFKSNGRAVFQGASIGLWAGLLFGSYIVITHSLKKSQAQAPVEPRYEENYYPETDEGPYEEQNYMGPYDDYPAEEGPQVRKIDSREFHNSFKLTDNIINKMKPGQSTRPTFYMDLVTVTF